MIPRPVRSRDGFLLTVFSEYESEPQIFPVMSSLFLTAL